MTQIGPVSAMARCLDIRSRVKNRSSSSGNTAGEVWFVLRAFSRPATWFARLGAPITRRVQQRIADVYVQTLTPGEHL